MTLPIWARLLRAVDRAAYLSHRVFDVLRDELLFAALDPDLRSEYTALAYGNLTTYLPGGSTFEEGLSSWEQDLLRGLLLPGRGRVLLGGAGGGRELKELLRLGYDVLAFEPNSRLMQGARSIAESSGKARVFQASYADLVQRAAGRAGSLPDPMGEFDLVWLGWGSFTHLTTTREQEMTLQACRILAPQAPCALSFYLRKSLPVVQGRSDRFRSSLRRALSRLGTKREIPSGLSFDFLHGFAYAFEIAEFHSLVERVGYRVEHFNEFPFAHAVLMPSVLDKKQPES